jgi:SM-20-related protein
MIAVNDDLFDKDDLQSCLSWLHNANWSYGWKSNADVNFGHWNTDITKTGINNNIDVTDRLPDAFQPLWAKIKEQYPDAILTRCYANQHTFGTEGYIHTDTERKEDHTCVIYMNREWDADWGGETAFFNNSKTEILKSVLPKFGRAAIFSGNLQHCARGVSRICNRSRMTLMFKFSINPQAHYAVEAQLKGFLLAIGANQKPHKNGSLMDHLMRTFMLLKGVNLSDSIALAGGLHSVYGTSSYKNGCLPADSTLVADTFGEDVDYMVRLFGLLDRPDDLKDGSRLSERDLFLMRCIEVANLYDQGELHLYPHLQDFLHKYKTQ